MKATFPQASITALCTPYIASFSEDGDSLLQWGFYGDGGKGYAVGFALSPSDETDPGPALPSCLGPLHYDEPSIPTGFAPSFRMWPRRSPPMRRPIAWIGTKPVRLATGAGPFALKRIAERTVRHKNADYAAEREWRMLVYVSERMNAPVRFRVGAGGLSAYMEFCSAHRARVSGSRRSSVVRAATTRTASRQ